MKAEWMNAFGKMTYGIYVLTTCHQQQINGMIASWVSQASYEPPLITVAVHTQRYSHKLIEKGGSFALHALAKSQADLLPRFKGRDPQAKFSALNWTPGQTGCPILSGCLAYLECELRARYRPGDHTLFVGQVIDAAVLAKGSPLTSGEYEGVYLGKA
jgi:flavin reductase (DIM6/NTAB) family NADH-FMN oxidoreductase RutF